jgi:hypothetical protein
MPQERDFANANIADAVSRGHETTGRILLSRIFIRAADIGCSNGRVGHVDPFGYARVWYTGLVRDDETNNRSLDNAVLGLKKFGIGYDRVCATSICDTGRDRSAWRTPWQGRSDAAANSSSSRGAWRNSIELNATRLNVTRQATGPGPANTAAVNSSAIRPTACRRSLSIPKSRKLSVQDYSIFDLWLVYLHYLRRQGNGARRFHPKVESVVQANTLLDLGICLRLPGSDANEGPTVTIRPQIHVTHTARNGGGSRLKFAGTVYRGRLMMAPRRRIPDDGTRSTELIVGSRRDRATRLGSVAIKNKIP